MDRKQDEGENKICFCVRDKDEKKFIILAKIKEIKSWHYLERADNTCLCFIEFNIFSTLKIILMHILSSSIYELGQMSHLNRPNQY